MYNMGRDWLRRLRGSSTVRKGAGYCGLLASWQRSYSGRLSGCPHHRRSDAEIVGKIPKIARKDVALSTG